MDKNEKFQKIISQNHWFLRRNAVSFFVRTVLIVEFPTGTIFTVHSDEDAVQLLADPIQRVKGSLATIQIVSNYGDGGEDRDQQQHRGGSPAEIGPQFAAKQRVDSHKWEYGKKTREQKAHHNSR